MTRLELLKILVGQARQNGFEFRRWYITRLGLPWISSEAAFILLSEQRRYYALLFSHEFASLFWKPGSEITFQVPASTFQRTMPDGTVATIYRKPFTRRTTRPDAWRYHLREMAMAEEPLRYMRKYLAVEDELDEEPVPAQLDMEPPLLSDEKDTSLPEVATPPRAGPRRAPQGLPAFLRRVYS